MVSDQYLVTTLIPSLHPNLNGFVPAQIMRATMPNASMYMQLNIIAVKAQLLSFSESSSS
jgi:hypothetical protein